jgi:hypothetical protein
VLFAAAALQLAWTAPPQLPAASGVVRPYRPVLPDLGGEVGQSPQSAAAIFDPARTAGGPASASGPLAGATVAGMVAVRGRAFAIIQRPAGDILRLPVGGVFAGYRLRGFVDGAAVFDGAGGRTRVPFGQPAPAADSETEVQEDE